MKEDEIMVTLKSTLYALSIMLFAGLLAGCGPSAEKRYQSGYSDGYAEGYNTTLEIRATIVAGDWDDKHYSRGYNDGRKVGVRDALNN